MGESNGSWDDFLKWSDIVVIDFDSHFVFIVLAFFVYDVILLILINGRVAKSCTETFSAQMLPRRTVIGRAGLSLERRSSTVFTGGARDPRFAMARLLSGLVLLEMRRQDGIIDYIHWRMGVVRLDCDRFLIFEDSDADWALISGKYTSHDVSISIVLAGTISGELMLSLGPASLWSQPGRKRSGCSIVELLFLDRLRRLSGITFSRLGTIFVCGFTVVPGSISFGAKWTTVCKLSLGR